MNSGDQFEVEGLMQISAEFVLEQVCTKSVTALSL
jgi:hypothetical protein